MVETVKGLGRLDIMVVLRQHDVRMFVWSKDVEINCVRLGYANALLLCEGLKQNRSNGYNVFPDWDIVPTLRLGRPFMEHDMNFASDDDRWQTGICYKRSVVPMRFLSGINKEL